MTNTKAPSLVSGWICRSCRQHQTRGRSLPRAWITPRNLSSSATLTSTGTTSTAPVKRGKLPETPARTRFAPSPTGNLHLGSIRTALFNYLVAKSTKGQFLLRIEDTDAKRTVPGAEDRLYADLKWAGLEWDEGPVVGGPYGPYRQSERLAFYQEHIQTLLQTSQAYRCFCSTERIDDLNRRRHDKGLPLGYDRKCTHIPKAEAEQRAHDGEAHVIRFRAPDHWPRYNDLIYGKSGHGAEKARKLLVDEPVYEDSVLIKSDGFPTYHWANICDDHDMKITHVVRGSEWMSSTPLHVALYQSLDWTPPIYAHVPLLVDANRQKLSKRNLDSDISSFRSQGIYPESLLNFAALLGWSHQQKSDIMDLPALTAVFDLKITKGNTIVSLDKLRYLQEHHARRRIEANGPAFEQMIRDVAVAVLDKYGAARIQEIVGASRSLHDFLATTMQIKSLPFRSAEDFASQLSIFLDPIPSSLPTPSFITSDQASLLHPLRVAASTLLLTPASSWTQGVHRANLSLLETSLPPAPSTSSTPPSAPSALSPKQWKSHLYHYLRWALLNGRTGPGIPETLDVLGPEMCRQRIQAANVRSKEIEVEMTRPVLRSEGWKGDEDGKRRVEKVWNSYSL